MLALGRAKSGSAGVAIRFEQADVLNLRYEDDSFDVASIAFGIRNVVDPEQGLREMARTVRPGGRVVVLEFGQPDGAIFGPAYRLYSRRILPVIGGWVSGQRAAYEYLDRTSSRFPAGERFAALMRETGSFRSVSAHPMTGGVAYVYVGEVGGAA
jgi:demethylmenaquinone methyltransferase/2-methoxy-6-polyprenyl-1,4-benzoquinol methylase